MRPACQMLARAHLVTSSPSHELRIRLGITAALAVAIGGVLALPALLDPAGGSAGAVGWLIAVGVGTALAFAPLAGGLHRAYRRSSPALDVTLLAGSGGLRCKSLWGDRVIGMGELRGACALDQAHESVLVVTLRDGATWIFELENAAEVAAARAALELTNGFSGRVRLSIRTKAGGLGCAQMFSAAFVALIWIAYGLTKGTYAVYAVYLGALVATLPIAIGFFAEIVDTASYAMLTVGEGEVQIEGVGDARLEGPFELVKLPDAVEIRSGNRPPVRVHEAGLAGVGVISFLARCVEAAGAVGRAPR